MVLPIPTSLFLIHLTKCGKLLCLNKNQLKGNLQTTLSLSAQYDGYIIKINLPVKS